MKGPIMSTATKAPKKTEADLLAEARAEQVAKLRKNLAKGSLTARAFINAYGVEAVYVLMAGGAITLDTKKTGKQNYYKADKVGLPEWEALDQRRNKQYTYNAAEIISGGFSDLEELAGEIREVVDNAPEGLQESDRNQTLGTTADTLEGLSEPSAPKLAAFIKVIVFPDRSGKNSRSHRRDVNTSEMRTAMEAIQNWVAEGRDHLQEYDDLLDELGECKKSDSEESQELRNQIDAKIAEINNWIDVDIADGRREPTDFPELKSDDLDELDEFVSDVESAIEEADGCDFPGMYG